MENELIIKADDFLKEAGESFKAAGKYFKEACESYEKVINLNQNQDNEIIQKIVYNYYKAGESYQNATNICQAIEHYQNLIKTNIDINGR